jgi:hypothetical protein
MKWFARLVARRVRRQISGMSDADLGKRAKIALSDHELGARVRFTLNSYSDAELLRTVKSEIPPLIRKILNL